MASLNFLKNYYKSDDDEEEDEEENNSSTEEETTAVATTTEEISNKNENFNSILTKFEINAAPVVLYSVNYYFTFFQDLTSFTLYL